ncbi:MAG: TonB-dependent receptor [Flavobacteriales bacterium]|nr:MAG: TonB-dependent receptor [Flavobacteriales bacterium]
MKLYIASLLLLVSFIAHPQQPLYITALDTVFLKSEKLPEKSMGQSIVKLDRKQLANYTPQLSECLQFETPVYIKENGYGMVASPSFRGTTAQQTAVVWNGVNINSPFLGQVDFNLINTQNSSEILIRPGGGSSQFGSGAIGGVVYLNNNLSYNKPNEHELSTTYGSFNTINLNTNHSIYRQNSNIQIGLSYLNSDNDYKYPNTGQRNLNGAYRNLNASINAAYRFKKNSIKIYSNWLSGERHLSVLEPTQNFTKYTDGHFRLLTEYKNTNASHESVIKLALLNEKYRFYPNLDNRDGSSNGNALNYIVKYNYKYFFNKALLNLGATYNLTIATGTNYDNLKRNSANFNTYFKHSLVDNFSYQATLRGEWSNDYNSPLLFSLGTHWQLKKWYAVKTSISKNFRIPTFNDLYWPGVENPDLKPESSLQFEVANTFYMKDLTFNITGYFNSIKDLIRWLPASGSLWQPVNTNSVYAYGVEAIGNYKFNFGTHSFNLKGLYAYTVSENRASGYQLIYVPYHKATLGLNYLYKNISVVINNLYHGKVFTQTDNNPNTTLSAYTLTHLNLYYQFGNTLKWQLGAGIKNVFNSAYQNMAYRPMPGRHFNISLTLNIKMT